MNERYSSTRPPYEDFDCHRPIALTLADYTEGYMVRTRRRGMTSVWHATFSDQSMALCEVRACLNKAVESRVKRMWDSVWFDMAEVSIWHNGRPVEIWKWGQPQMGSGVTL